MKHNRKGKGEYGRMNVGYKLVYAHRFSYLFHFKTLSNDLDVLHKCDNPKCVNPKHLFLGTDQDNANDKVTKGRCPTGENHCKTRLKDSDVRQIKHLLRTSNLTQKAIAVMFNVGKFTIGDIKRGKNWKHIK
jgi:hypothetical protein